jgi:hypothetical protein
VPAATVESITLEPLGCGGAGASTVVAVRVAGRVPSPGGAERGGEGNGSKGSGQRSVLRLRAPAAPRGAGAGPFVSAAALAAALERARLAAACHLLQILPADAERRPGSAAPQPARAGRHRSAPRRAGRPWGPEAGTWGAALS